ncbi:DinB family protein [Maribacter sp. 2308TA10-17]|uniref:DinB family protein n=1 Tax=Maribacter sp. 2308TA10-17 TaxID=3386276 RepID=UPI0039BC37AB
MKVLFSSILILVSLTCNAQEMTNDSLPYASIPEAFENYTSGTVVARMIDGLGFRYYWATHGITEDNLKYEPGNEGRTIDQTLDHIYGLSAVILNAAKKMPNDRTTQPVKLEGLERRQKTLENLKEASTLFASSTDLNEHHIIFETKNGTAQYPFWNGINGPIEDAIWHAGQIVVMRRSAGNPINPRVNVFLGKLNE